MNDEIECINCHDWLWEKEENEWDTCPNCDFPRKYIGWIEHLQQEIRDLQGENDRLRHKLTGVLNE